jgi:hypothetical protein
MIQLQTLEETHGVIAVPIESGNRSMATQTVIPSNVRQFDLSPIVGLSDKSKYQGNTVSDIKSAYQTYISNTPIGKGGEYAVSAQQKYGFASVRDAAAAYLQRAGLDFVADIVQPNNPVTPVNPDGDGPFYPLPPTPETTTPTPKNPFELLLDALPNLFGQQVYNPPLQSQTYGYTPQQSLDSGQGFSIMPIVILLAIAAVGYFLYKKYA